MSRVCIDFLLESFLYNDEYLENEFYDYSDVELDKEISRYRKHIVTMSTDLNNFIFDQGKETVAFDSFSGYISIEELKSILLYANTVYLNDPLFSLSEKHSDLSIVYASAIGRDISYRIDRREICKAIRYIKSLQTAIGLDAIVLMPLDYFHEQKGELDNWDQYNIEITPEIKKYIEQKTYVCAAVESEGDLIPIKNSPPNGGNAIFIGFEGFDDGVFIQPMLFDTRVNPPIPVRKRVLSESELQEEVDLRAPLYLQHVLHELIQEFSIINRLGATYVTNSTFLSGLLSYCADNEDVNREMASMAQKLDLSELKTLSLSEFLMIRDKASSSFSAFQQDLQRDIRDIYIICDNGTRERSLQRLSDTIEKREIARANNEYRIIKGNTLFDIGKNTISCSIKFATEQTLFARLMNCAEGLISTTKSIKKLKGNKYYFLSLLSNKQPEA